MTEESPAPLIITDHQQLDDAIAYHEIRASTPVVDQTGTCLDFIQVPIPPGQAHEMLRIARANDGYNLCLQATYHNDDEEVHLEIVDQA